MEEKRDYLSAFHSEKEVGKWFEYKPGYSEPMQMLLHNTIDNTFEFVIDTRNKKDFYTESTIDYCTLRIKELRHGLCSQLIEPIKDIKTAKQFVDNAIKDKDLNQEEHVNYDEFSKHIQLQNEQQLKEEQLLKTENIKKAGYVQGVCECVAIVDNTKLGKKLLSEMKVTQDMAKQYADPKTYESLEKTVFAPKPVQEQKQSRKR